MDFALGKKYQAGCDIQYLCSNINELVVAIRSPSLPSENIFIEFAILGEQCMSMCRQTISKPSHPLFSTPGHPH